MNWEYMVVDSDLGSIEELQLRLNALGSLGWEAVGYSCVVQLGPNGMSTLLKREAATLAAPANTAADWYTDPAKRHELRHWDGLRWTQHVIDAGTTSTDFPNLR